MVYSDHQRLELEKEFHYSRYITIRRKAELAQALSLSERQVKKEKADFASSCAGLLLLVLRLFGRDLIHVSLHTTRVSK